MATKPKLKSIAAHPKRLYVPDADHWTVLGRPLNFCNVAITFPFALQSNWTMGAAASGLCCGRCGQKCACMRLQRAATGMPGLANCGAIAGGLGCDPSRW